MTNPTWVTAENIKFDGTLTDVAVLKNAAGIRTVAEWNNLSESAKQLLISLVDDFGGTVPLAAATAGKQSVKFTSAVVGGTATGLGATAAATAGYATIDLGAAKVGTDASGLSSAAGTNGYAVANFQPGVTAGTSLGLTPTQGYQVVDFGGTATGAGATSLVAETTYTATVTVDGVAKSISILGSAAQTFTDLVTEINTDLGASAVAAIVNGDITITSATYGTASTVSITAGTLFAAPLAGFVDVNTAVAGTGATSYSMTVAIDGAAATTVTIDPLVVATFGDLVTAINTAIGVNGTAAISGGDLRVTSASYGASSKVVLTTGTLLTATPGFVGLLPPANGGGTARTYSATVVVDGTTIKTVSFGGAAGNTVQHVIDEINTDLGASATASLTGGDIVITSATSGVGSSVVVYDSGFLFSSLTGYAGIVSTAGTAASAYSATVVVDGVSKAIAVAGSAAQTFTDLVTEINTDLGASATAAVTGGDLVITSATTGTTSTIQIVDGNLFKSLSAFRAIGAPVNGASDFTEVMSRRTSSGVIPSDVIPVKVVGAKPPVPANATKSVSYVYFDGSAWKYLVDDTAV